MAALINRLHNEAALVLGYGDSTNGNVILQFCRFTTQQLPCIAEVNEEKFGGFTPGTAIPIISEAEARAMKADYFLVMPWHFRESLIERHALPAQQSSRVRRTPRGHPRSAICD